MSHNKMLIDATHPEETRVVVLRNGRVEEFDFESAARALLRGNIYLAKVTRVEPSLQAAFIDYGGNRHGFLAFNEIHPDYYTIPVADRQALLDEEAAADAAEEAEADRRAEARAARGASDTADDAEENAIDVTELLPPETIEPIGPGGLPADADRDRDVRHGDADDYPLAPTDAGADAPADRHNLEDAGPVGDVSTPHSIGAVENQTVVDVAANEDPAVSASPVPETVANAGADDALEELATSRPRRRARSYNIQEVIKRRQIILVQIVKEERGTKGAALTTYLSLAGRYTVLMPNTARGGGISRKITNAPDRKRLKAIAQELEVPDGMGLIIRTAGAARTKQEIKRDFEYLLRLWESVRDMTLQSTAPSLVYEEGDLIKRSIRDLYTKEVDEIIVAGSHAHKEARDFMAMLMPSHARNVIDYKSPEPLFNKFQIERQLNAMFSPIVNLRSGGYLVINQTEALVAIDINSGKSTREFSIEETALNTNLEAADEIARQLKLRDLAGLIVIDFIDMEEKRNNRAVERRINEALRFDRARIQVGRISHFGLLEMSRQRLRTGVLEGSTTQCPHCQGTGTIRSTESVALAVIRALEDTLIGDGRSSLIANTTANVALYILNHKRNFIVDMETRYGVSVVVQASDKMQGANFSIERSSTPVLAARRPDKAAVNMDWGFNGEGGGNEPADIEPIDDEIPAAEARAPRTRDDDAADVEAGDAPRSRRRRRRGGRDRGDRPDGRRDGRHESAGPTGNGSGLETRDDERPARGPTGEVEQVGDDAQAGGHDGPRYAQPRDAAADADGETSTERGGRVAGEEGDADGTRARRGRRRGRRGGRRGRETARGDANLSAQDGTDSQQGDAPPSSRDDTSADTGDQGGDEPDAPDARSAVIAATHRAPRHEHADRSDDRRDQHANGGHDAVATVEAPVSAMPLVSTPAAEPIAATAQPVAEPPIASPPASLAPTEDAGPPKPIRKGWWQRQFSGE